MAPKGFVARDLAQVIDIKLLLTTKSLDPRLQIICIY